MPCQVLLTALWLLLAVDPLLAAKLPDSVQIHGFASQGFIVTSDNDFFGKSSDGGTFDFRELGLNSSWRPFNSLQISAQGLYRDAGLGDEGTLRLDYGFADYSLVSNESNLLGVRAGRIKTPFGLYNETRDVAFTRPGILLPQSIYPDRLRNLSLSGDGLELYNETHAQWGDLALVVGAGYPVLEEDDSEPELTFLRSDLPGRFTSQISYIGRALYERDNGRLRFGLTVFELNLDYRSRFGGFPLDLQDGAVNVNQTLLSAQYNAERWSLTAEYARTRSNLLGLGPFPRRKTTGESYYVQGVYRFNAKWEALLRYDATFSDINDRYGRAIGPFFGVPPHNAFARDWTTGLSWNISPAFTIRAEYHRINGTAWLPRADNPDLSDSSQHWELFSLLGSYRF